jgi:hypothetical protein
VPFTALLCYIFDLVVSVTKFSLICLFFLQALQLNFIFHIVIHVHLVSYHFVFQFLQFIVFMEHAHAYLLVAKYTINFDVSARRAGSVHTSDC